MNEDEEKNEHDGNKTCPLHFENHDGLMRPFSPKTFQTFLDRRNQWLSLGMEYKDFVTVTRHSLESIPGGITNVMDLDENCKHYHVSCYQLFTNKEKLQRAQKSNTNTQTAKSILVEPCEEESLEQPRRKSKRIELQQDRPPSDTEQPSSSAILRKKCLICNQYGPKFVKDKKEKKRIRQELSQSQTVGGGLLYDTAVWKNDEDLLLHIRDLNLASAEARYHRQCYYDYTQEYANILSRKPKLINVTDDVNFPFKQFCIDVVEKRLISGEDVLTLKKLLKMYNTYDDNNTMTTARLKEKLTSKYPSLHFFQPKSKNKSMIVYCDILTPGNVLDDSIHANDLSTVDESSQDESQDDEQPTTVQTHIENRELYYSAMYIRNIISKIENDIPWPPDSTDLSYENAARMIPDKLKHFLALLLGFSNDPLSAKLNISESDMKKVVSISQDLINVSTSGRTLTPKALALGVTTRQLTGSQRVVQLLNQFGHSVSPDVLYKHDSALTESISTQSTFVPRNISIDIPTTLVWDNNDFTEETLSGKGTTHVANGIVIQNRNMLEPVNLREKVNLPKTSKSSVTPPSTVIEPYILAKKVSPDYTKVNKDLVKPNIPFLQIDNETCYIITKFCASLKSLVLPSWTGYNIECQPPPDTKSEIGYLPIIDAPVTELDTINALLWKSISICDELNLPDITLVFDEAIYAKVQLIRWGNDILKERLVIRLGDFHCCMSFCSGISKIFQHAGLQDILVESDVIALGSINTVMSGKQYNRSVRAHKLMYEALQRLRFKSFYDSLDDDMKTFVQNVSENLTVENYTQVPDGLKDIIDTYLAYVDVQSDTNPTFHFWSSYINMVQLLLLYIRATRTSDWKLHLQTVRLMLPWFFVTDRTNYSRYLPCYFIEMVNLKQTHPYTASHIESTWTVQRNREFGFSSIACDQTIEQTLNRDSKTPGGVIGFTLDRPTMHKWDCLPCGKSGYCQQSSRDDQLGKKWHQETQGALVIQTKK